MIYFKCIRFKNFLSYGNNFVEFELNKNKTTLIVGKNGHGKSAIIDAISFVLFGRAFRNINKSKLVNSITKKNCVVEIEFQYNNKNYLIRRGINPEVFDIYEDGILIKKPSTNTEYQQILQNILKINFKSFFQICVLGKANFAPFLSMDAARRREIIENLLDIQQFSVMNTLLKTKIDDNKKQLSESETEIKILENKLKIHQEHIEKLNQNNDKLIEEKTKRHQEYKEIIDQTQIDIEKFANEIKIKKELIKDQEKVNKRVISLKELNKKLKNKLQKLNEDIKFYTDNDNCPECKQIIDQSFKNDTIITKKYSIEEINKGIIELDKENTKILERLSEIEKINDQISDINGKITSNNNKIYLNNQLIKNINKEIENLKKNHIGLKNDVDVKETQKKLDEFLKIKETSLNKKQILDICSLLLKDSGIKAKIIMKYVPIMNKLINKYLAALDFFVNFELSETFEETIKSRYRDEFSYYSFSEGEKFRIDIAVLLCWRAIAKQRNSFNTNILLLDEVFDASLDSQGVDDFIKILKSLPNDVNVFVISHKVDILLDKFDKVINIEKKKNFSGIK